jgi:hypothetical protein
MTEDCTTCQLARWQRTKTGRLHPSGNGRCSWDGWKEWKIPKTFFYTGGHRDRMPLPSGGYINRRDPCTDCPLYQPIIIPTSPQQ